MADVFLLTSKRETFSLTCAEALCCGTPVVGFKCGAPETVFTTKRATFVEQGDIVAIQTALYRIFKTECGRKQRYQCAKESRALYGRRRMVDQYMDEYRVQR